MATKIVTKNSSTASAVPTASDLVQGELAVNVADKRLFTEDNAGAIVELGTNPSTIDINAGTIDGTAIGASSASTGAFTTLTATGAFTSVGIDDNATSTAITIDSSENVGIGTSSPSEKLTVDAQAADGSTTTIASFHSNEGEAGDTAVQFAVARSDALGSGRKTFLNATGAGNFEIQRSGTTVATIDGSGNVGIGQTTIIDSASGRKALTIGGSLSSIITFGNAGTRWGGIYASSADYSIFSDSLMRFEASGSERMRIDSAGRVGIGNTVASSMDGGANNLVIGSGSGTEGMTIYSGTTNSGTVYFADGASGDDRFRGQINYAHSDNSLNFRTNASSTPQMTLDSSGNVGIGTSSISGRLEIKKATASNEILFGIEASGVTTTTLGSITYDQSDDSMRLLNNSDFGGTTLRLGTRGNDNLVIDYSGNVGIGTSSPDAPLDIKLNTNSTADIFKFQRNDGAVAGVLNYSGTDGAISLGTTTSHDFTFDTAGSERMRIDSSGNLLVGNTVANPASGFSTQRGFGYTNSTGKVEIATTANDAVMEIGKNNANDGNLIVFRKQGTSVGSIGSRGGEFIAVGSGDTFLEFNFGSDQINPSTGSAARDNAIDLGSSGARFDDIYATNGTIQTSDFNEKQDIAELSDAEKRVAVACKGLLRKFRWKDSVAEKGDEARTHFGIIAQDLQAAFAAEGLDAGDYAMFISTTWTDEETNEEKTRMGVRYSELLAFIIAAI